MKTKVFFCSIFLCSLINVFATEIKFEDYFINKSLRIDFVLTGNSDKQEATLLQLYQEPYWSGPKVHLLEPLSYGSYEVILEDLETKQPIYSRSFNTLFEEWRTTPEAKKYKESWINSIVTPFPKHPISISIRSRDRHNPNFTELFRMNLSPEDLIIDKSHKEVYPTFVIQEKGSPDTKVDLLFLGDGYTKEEIDLFEADAKKFTEALFTFPPFSNHREDFNVRAVCAPSLDSGCDIAGKGIFKNTAVNSGFYTFGIERYLTTRDMKAIRDQAANTPCDAVFILVNIEKYGGGGMYNLYAIGTTRNDRTPQVFVHELGHSFAGLADEYYTSEVSYEGFYNQKDEPWEPNLTTLVNFDSKWKNMIPEGTPIPTPADDDRYNKEVGVFEGGGYVAKGVYRPAVHCMMKDMHPFCPVCSKTIENMIDYHCGRPPITK